MNGKIIMNDKTKIVFEDCEMLSYRIEQQLSEKIDDLQLIENTIRTIQDHREPKETKYIYDEESGIGGIALVPGESKPIDRWHLEHMMFDGCFPKPIDEMLGKKSELDSTDPVFDQIKSKCEVLFDKKKIELGEYPLPTEDELADDLKIRPEESSLTQVTDPMIGYFCRPGKMDMESSDEYFTDELKKKFKKADQMFKLGKPWEPEQIRDPYSGHIYHF